MGKVMRHTLGASLNIRHNLSSSKGPKPLQLKLDRKSGSAGMPRPNSYAVFCLKKKIGHDRVEINAQTGRTHSDQEREWLVAQHPLQAFCVPMKDRKSTSL